MNLGICVYSCRGVRAELLEGRHAVRPYPAGGEPVRASLDDSVGERLIDRAQRDGTLTQAGVLLARLRRAAAGLADEARAAVHRNDEGRAGRIQSAAFANEAAVNVLLPIIRAYLERHPRVQIDIRRVSSRIMPAELQQRSIDLGVMTFLPRSRAPRQHAGHRRARPPRAPGACVRSRAEVPLDEVGRQPSSRTTIRLPRANACCASRTAAHTRSISRFASQLDGIKRAWSSAWASRSCRAAVRSRS